MGYCNALLVRVRDGFVDNWRLVVIVGTCRRVERLRHWLIHYFWSGAGEEERAYDRRRPPTGSSDKLCVKRVIGIRQSQEAKADIGVGVNI